MMKSGMKPIIPTNTQTQYKNKRNNKSRTIKLILNIYYEAVPLNNCSMDYGCFFSSLSKK